jgi:hypothetical protein
LTSRKPTPDGVPDSGRRRGASSHAGRRRVSNGRPSTKESRGARGWPMTLQDIMPVVGRLGARQTVARPNIRDPECGSPHPTGSSAVGVDLSRNSERIRRTMSSTCSSACTPRAWPVKSAPTVSTPSGGCQPTEVFERLAPVSVVENGSPIHPDQSCVTVCCTAQTAT